jgi:uncharacterized protein YfdQ (DUF2303 family)
MAEKNVVETALQAGADSVISRLHNMTGVAMPFIVRPDGTLVPHENLLYQPTRVRAAVMFETPASFVEYVRLFRTGDTLVFASQADAQFMAVLDYHRPPPSLVVPGTEPVRDALDAVPHWGEHRAKMTLSPTESWTRWMASDGKQKSQVDFAEFIEDNLQDIAVPAGAVIKELSLSLSATRSATFSSSVRLSNGSTAMNYEDTVEGRVGAKGAVAIPETFTLGLIPYEGCAKYEVTARFRYRIEQGVLRVWYALHRPDEIRRDAFVETISVVQDALKMPVLRVPNVVASVAMLSR